jgi:hypothetical protein
MFAALTTAAGLAIETYARIRRGLEHPLTNAPLVEVAPHVWKFTQ